MKTIKGAAFDMDGLMFETESIHYREAEILLNRRGFAYTEQLFLDTLGCPPEPCFRKFIETYTLPETWEELAKESENIFLELLQNGCEYMPGLCGLLDALDAARIPKCVATSSSKRVADAILTKDDIAKRFSFVLTCEDIVRGKPDPQIYLLAAERLGIQPGELAVFEDSSAGVASAKGAGAACIALRAEHNKNADLSGADLVVSALDAEGVLERIHG